MMRVRKRVRVSGHVQNVWFRDATRSEAERLGLSGWVRNLTDGRVEIEAEGPFDAVETLAVWAHAGPPRASVREVEVETIPTSGGSGFEIRLDSRGQGRA
jgi:acylphosphatase